MPRPALTTADRDRGRRLSAALSAARQKADLSQSALATRAGISLDTLRALERNRTATPSFFLVADIARALQVPLDQLVAKPKKGRST